VWTPTVVQRGGMLLAATLVLVAGLSLVTVWPMTQTVPGPQQSFVAADPYTFWLVLLSALFAAAAFWNAAFPVGYVPYGFGAGAFGTGLALLSYGGRVGTGPTAFIASLDGFFLVVWAFAVVVFQCSLAVSARRARLREATRPRPMY
jgi:hypothetical protein